jgi:type II secretory pathway pseudopilin PulG
MRIDPSTSHRTAAGGFTLPVILVVVGALLILAVGILLVAGIERGTARSFADRQRAELAARAALEEIRGILTNDAANDDFLVIQSDLAASITAGRQSAPQHFLVRGKAAEGGYSYRYVPLFSARRPPEDQPQLAPPSLEPLFGTDVNEWIDFSTLPYTDKVRAAWLPIKDEKGRTVARYAYWVEDLQGRLDPALAGNLGGPDLTHTRAAHPFPAPGLNPDPESDAAAPLNQIGLFAIEPATTSISQGTLGKMLIENRRLLVSPDSTLAAAGIAPPLLRDGTGHLGDPKARAAEESLAANLQPYFERPLIPFAPGIDPAVAGRPRMNLNALLAMKPDDAVDEMAAFVRAALPDFDTRKGGFPEDYLKTLAANAIDYADADSNPTLKSGEYRGLDACPLLSEIALQVNYAGISNQQDRKIMSFRFKLFAELCNPTSQRASGDARLSYEVALPMDGIGAGVGGEPFDSPALLSDPAIATHDLALIDGGYWTRQVRVELEPNQYRCYLFADVVYRMDVGASAEFIPDETPFSLNEARAESGLSLMWNGEVTSRTPPGLR